ncbi:MAG TPA: hypothetical protein VFQ67_01025 [Allosphingosinicella sp.]|jgi:hypothetical protein|nr:hypothetical protein [Allosphingosinicella sp.]
MARPRFALRLARRGSRRQPIRLSLHFARLRLLSIVKLIPFLVRETLSALIFARRVRSVDWIILDVRVEVDLILVAHRIDLQETRIRDAAPKAGNRRHD